MQQQVRVSPSGARVKQLRVIAVRTTTPCTSITGFASHHGYGRRGAFIATGFEPLARATLHPLTKESTLDYSLGAA